MGFLGSIFGTSGGPSAVDQAYAPVQAGQIGGEMGDQFKSAIANQGQLYNQQQALLGQQSGLMGQQQSFADALKAQAAGQGPSVAGQQLQQALQQQQAASAAQAAGARGINPALAARQAGEQQAQASQATAQSAALARAQEQLNAQGMLGGALGQMGANIGQQGNILGQMSGQQAGLQQLGLEAQRANQAANLQADIATRGIGQQQGQQQAGLTGGLLGAVGQGLTMMSKGGQVKGYDDGGSVAATATPGQSSATSIIGRMLGGSGPTDSSGKSQGFDMSKLTGGQALGAGIGHLLANKPKPQNPAVAGPKLPGGGFLSSEENLNPEPGQFYFGNKGGKVPAMVSPGEIYLTPDQAKNKKQAMHEAAYAAALNKKIPGKAKVKGDSEENDTVHAELEEGGIVIPRTKSKSPDKASAFVQALMKQKGKKS